MSQLTYCDMCKEIIRPNDKKFIFGYYPCTEEDEETNKQRFEEIIKALYQGRLNKETSIKIVEICSGCAGVFAHFVNLRKKELIKSRREVKRMLTRKAKKEKVKEIKNSKEEKKK